MSKVLVVAQVEDAAKWEASFRTHGNLFKTYGLKGPVEYGLSGNSAAVCLEPENVQSVSADVTGSGNRGRDEG
jgi:hypothetical protein